MRIIQDPEFPFLSVTLLSLYRDTGKGGCDRLGSSTDCSEDGAEQPCDADLCVGGSWNAAGTSGGVHCI